LKKQKAKKAGGGKKKEDKKEADAAEAEASTAAEKTEEKAEELAAPQPPEATSASPGPVDDDDDDDEPTELPKAQSSHNRKPSIAVESRMRSASFYRGGDGTPTSPPPITPGGGVSGDIYREQAQRIEELERENKKLGNEVEEGKKRWKKGEEELEELREARGDVAVAVERGKEADKLVCDSRNLCLVLAILIGFVEVGSRITKAPAIAPPNTIVQVFPTRIHNLSKSIRLHRRSECSGSLEVSYHRVA
jgi:hypothetical protein